MPLFSKAGEKPPHDLRCEYLTDPLGIDVAVPRFNWKLAPSSNDRGRMQSAYQVRVAGSRALLEQDRADLWDSGITISTQSALIPYGGKRLVSNQDCYWQVRVFDQDKKPSEWSDPARFSMGLLDASDWTGPWIRHPDAPAVKHIWFRKSFTIGENPDKAFVHISTVGYHELYINGERIGDGHLAPAATRLDKRALYLTHDITSLLKTGKNTIAVWHGPGWGRYSFFKTQPALRVQLNATTPGGNALSIASDTSWRCQISSSENIGGTKYSDNGGEQIDARNHIADWNANDFDDSQWVTATTAAVDPVLSAQMIEPTRIIETIPAKSISGTGDTYKFDMGKNFSGWISIKLKGLSAGDTVTAMVADDDETVQDFGQKSIYISSGRDNEIFRNRFNYLAGRYITFTGLKQKPGLSDVTGHVLSTDLSRHGKFSSSDSLFNRIYETDLWTWRANLVEGFTMDCPHRERLGYGEVAFACAWGIAFPNYHSAPLYTKHVRDWSDVQEPNGWIHHTAPQINSHFGGPMWSSAGLNIAWDFYQNHGDKRILELTYPSSKRWLDFLDSHTKDGLLRNYSSHWGKFLGDWAAPGQRKERGDSPEALYFNNCVYAMNLMDFVAIARLLDKPADVALYSARLESLKPKIHQQFFNPGDHTYSGGTQVQIAFALLTGITPENLRPAVVSSFHRELDTKPYLDMGSSGLPVLFKYLVESASRSDALFTHLSRTNEPSYGYFLERDETTWPEYWNVDVPSRIHTCYTGVSSWFTKGLAGIRPDPAEPGFQSFLIHPVVGGGLDFAEGEMQSMYGRISSRWEISDTGLTLAVTIPPNSRATVSLPTLGTPAASLVIREGGSVIWENDKAASSLPAGMTFARRERENSRDSRIAWTVGSGTYRFTANLLATPEQPSAAGFADRITLRWKASPGAAAYTIGRSTKPGGPHEMIASDIVGTDYTDARVVRNQNYHYIIIPESASGQKGAPSSEASARSGLQEIRNPGFEMPKTTAFSYNPVDAGWKFTPLKEKDGSGITANQSPFTETNPAAPEGGQVAFIQGKATISQTLSGLLPGATYRVSFSAAQRKNRGTGGQSWDLQLDGKTIGSFAPPATATSYMPYHAEFTASAPDHTLGFVGTNKKGGDNTAFIDRVQLTAASGDN